MSPVIDLDGLGREMKQLYILRENGCVNFFRPSHARGHGSHRLPAELLLKAPPCAGAKITCELLFSFPAVQQPSQCVR